MNWSYRPSNTLIAASVSFIICLPWWIALSLAISKDSPNDTQYWKNTLFIGDSIFCGLSALNYIPYDNVFAKVGADASSILQLKIKGHNVSDTSKDFTTVIVMLGINSIRQDINTNIKNLQSLLSTLNPKAKIIILTLTPISPDNAYNITQDMVDNYNSALFETGLPVIDTCSELKNEVGYIKKEYVQSDGLHLTRTGYETLISLIKSKV